MGSTRFVPNSPAAIFISLPFTPSADGASPVVPRPSLPAQREGVPQLRLDQLVEDAGPLGVGLGIRQRRIDRGRL